MGFDGDFIKFPSSQRYEVVNDKEKFELMVDVPGIDANDIDVNVQGEHLSIKGERIVETEWSQSKSAFRQMFPLDDTVDVEKFSATLKNGVLTITAPKHIQNVVDGTRKIPVVSLSSEDAVATTAAKGLEEVVKNGEGDSGMGASGTLNEDNLHDDGNGDDAFELEVSKSKNDDEQHGGLDEGKN